MGDDGSGGDTSNPDPDPTAATTANSTKKLAPPHPLAAPEDSSLITSLLALSKKSPKLVKSSEYEVPGSGGVQVRSWKMNEFKYYDVPSPFPTLARGLFTTEVNKRDEEGEMAQRIVVRGYDKFFNIGEVPWTTWSALAENTSAPYTLSLKSNGCIIFISALTPEKLVITSKHSLGPVGNAPKSHAEAGEEWLKKYLEAKGKTEKDLAKRLWESNWTAVAELCDDSFEEHVLPYPPSLTGLHLHGLNTNTKAFHTLSHDAIDAFADEWGFIKTKSVTLNSVEEVKEFAERVGKEQVWEGLAVEGFVVRTKVCSPVKVNAEEGTKSREVKVKMPYEPNSTFFFKIKFDEPYMMYRDWRELTKALLSARAKSKDVPFSSLVSSLPKSKMRRKETKVYVKWVVGEIERDPKAFELYAKGKGIIATRERFLRWCEGEEGRKACEAEEGEAKAEVGKVGGGVEKFDKTIILPVAVPGCGKTTIAIALAHIFGFGHIQSDDIQVKKAAPIFIKKIAKLLETQDVVIADKNNHLLQHRLALRVLTKDFAKKIPGTRIRLLALDWSYSMNTLPPSTVHRVCTDRVLARGTNHQSLLADTSVARTHEDVVWMFINGMEELGEKEVDGVVRMVVGEGLEEAVERAVEGVWKVVGGEKPSEEKVREGIEEALGYVVVKGKKEKEKEMEMEKAAVTAKGPRYFGILPEVDLEAFLTPVMEGLSGRDSYNLWASLKDAKRITKRSHVTVVHSKSLKDEEEKGVAESLELWERCAALYAEANPPMFEMKLSEVVWDEKVMAVCVELIGVAPDSAGPAGSVDGDGDADKSQLGAEFVSKLPEAVRRRLHVTVGTKNEDIKPVEAKALVERWKSGEKEGVYSVRINGEEGVKVVGRVKGLIS